MADRNWKATGTGQFDLAANWEENAIVATGDKVYFRKGTQSVTSGLDQSTVSPLDFSVLKGYSGNIAITGTPLKFAAITGVLRFEGQGTAKNYIGTLNGIAEAYVFDAANLDFEGNITELFLQKGNVHVRWATCSKVFIGYEKGILTDVNVLFEDDASITELYQYGGTVEAWAAITDAIVSGGKLTHKGDQAARKITRLRIFAPGVVDYRAITGPDELLIGPRGLFDASANENAIVIGAAIMDEKSQMDLRNGRANITFGSGGLRLQGVAFPYFDKGRVLTNVAGT